MIGEISAGIESISLIRKILKKCKEVLTGDSDNAIVLKMKHPEQFEKVTFLLERASNAKPKKNDAAVNEFIKDYDIILDKTDGRYKVIRKKIKNRDIIPNIRSFKEKEANQKIDILPYSTASTFFDYEKGEKQIPSILSVSNNKKFSDPFKSLLMLSSEVKRLFSIGNKSSANIIKKSIRETYGEEGLRFCNCYFVGYVEIYLDFLKDKNEKEIEEKMWELSKMPIFFVSSHYNSLSQKSLIEFVKKQFEEIYKKIKNAMDENSNYLAIHGLGIAAEFAEDISKEISSKNVDTNYENLRIDRDKKIAKEKIRDFNKIWYNANGKSFCRLFNSLWISID
jgi:hypothetical protein